jgi:hypothetical protein
MGGILMINNIDQPELWQISSLMDNWENVVTEQKVPDYDGFF